MAVDLKYGTVFLEHGTIAKDEPVFVIRAQDRLAKELLWYYKSLCAKALCPQNHLDGIDAVRDQFAAWQADNRTQTPKSAKPEGGTDA